MSAAINPVNVGGGALLLLFGLAMAAFPRPFVSRRLRRLLRDEEGRASVTAVRFYAVFTILFGLLIALRGLTSPLR